MIEKCPKCGSWTYSLNRSRGEMECLRIDCGHREKVDVRAKLESDNYLSRVR